MRKKGKAWLSMITEQLWIEINNNKQTILIILKLYYIELIDVTVWFLQRIDKGRELIVKSVKNKNSNLSIF